MAEASSSSVRLPKLRSKPKIGQAPLYKVLVHDDEITPMSYVVEVLIEIFQLRQIRAAEVAAEAHLKRVALVATMTYEQAEFRVDQAHSKARGAGYPLTFSYEPV